jgi:hypothetical protein
MFDASSVEAQLARLEQAVDVLRTRYVCEGWAIDEAGAERALAYFRKGCPDDDEEWGSALFFMVSHGLSAGWIITGDPYAMIALRASQSKQAAKTDPIFEEIEEHKRAYAAVNVKVVKTDEWEAAIPKEKRKTFRVDEEVFETDDPRWLAHRRALHALFEAESDAECDLASIVPTTRAGVCALLKYGAEVEEHGCAWLDLWKTRTISGPAVGTTSSTATS